MTDYNWYSDAAVEVASDGIREEAGKWFDFADRMSRVAALAGDQALQASAFAVTDITGAVTASDLKQGYDKMQHWLTDLFTQATTELETFGEGLKKCADWYETTDANAAQDFDKVATS
jgi:hypothetical protein